MKYYNKHQWSLKPYRPASHKIWTVSPEERSEFLKLDWNEASVPPSPRVSERIHRLLEHENFYNLYPALVNPELNGLLSAYVGLPEEYMLYFSGSDVVHECVVRGFIAQGDSVLILGPAYDNFRLTAESVGAKIFFSEVTNDFVFVPEKFEADLDAVRPSFAYICSPNNPTGLFTDNEYIVHLLEKYTDTVFLVDEAYYEFAGETAAQLTKTYRNLVVTRTLSKAFALANFRFGYVISHPENIAHLSKIRNPKNIPTFTQEAACGALEDTAYMWRYVDEVRRAREWFFEELKKRAPKIEVFPSRSNSLLMRFPGREEKEGMFAYLTDHLIFVRPLSQSRLLDNCLRITVGTREQMKKVLACMDAFWKEKE